MQWTKSRTIIQAQFLIVFQRLLSSCQFITAYYGRTFGVKFEKWRVSREQKRTTVLSSSSFRSAHSTRKPRKWQWLLLSHRAWAGNKLYNIQFLFVLNRPVARYLRLQLFIYIVRVSFVSCHVTSFRAARIINYMHCYRIIGWHYVCMLDISMFLFSKKSKLSVLRSVATIFLLFF